MSKIAIYPGSFDPITRGHENEPITIEIKFRMEINKYIINLGFFNLKKVIKKF